MSWQDCKQRRLEQIVDELHDRHCKPDEPECKTPDPPVVTEVDKDWLKCRKETYSDALDDLAR